MCADYTPFKDVNHKSYDSSTAVDDILEEIGNHEMIIVDNPSEGQIRELVNSEFYWKPKKIRWYRDVPESEDEYLSQFSRLRRKVKKVGNMGFDIRVEDGDNLDLLQTWYEEIYNSAIGSKERGINRFLDNHSEEIENRTFYRDPLSENVKSRMGIYLLKGDEVCAGMMLSNFKKGAMDDIPEHLSIAYSAAQMDNKDIRKLNLEFYLLLKAMDLSREEGYGLIGMGMDTNLYGGPSHLSVGLVEYKKHLGFAPVPDKTKGDELLYLNLGTMSEPDLPIIFMSYGEEGDLFQKEINVL